MTLRLNHILYFESNQKANCLFFFLPKNCFYFVVVNLQYFKIIILLLNDKDLKYIINTNIKWIFYAKQVYNMHRNIKILNKRLLKMSKYRIYVQISDIFENYKNIWNRKYQKYLVVINTCIYKIYSKKKHYLTQNKNHFNN